MRVYVGEQDEVAGRCRVWIAHEEPRPDIREVVEVLGDLNRLMDFRRDGLVDVEYEQHRAATIARKNEIVEQIRRAEDVPRPTELAHRAIHSLDGFEWGYAGSGPADLAYSILLSEIGEPPTSPVYLRFRDDIVARLSGRSFRLPADVVWEWIETNRDLVQEELFDRIPAPGLANGPALAITNTDVPTDGASMDEASGSAVVRACEQAWRDIQSHHSELPDVVVILGTGVERGRLVKLGHWWGGRWIADGQARGEVLLAGEALHLPPAQVFEVLLHEAAHGLNAARRIPDTSRGGRYHNRRFAVTANEVLLDVESMPPYGFAATKLTEAAEKRYGPTIERLGEAMRIARQIGRGVKVGVEAEGQLEGGRDGSGVEREGKRNDAVTALCECGRRLRMAPSVYQQGPVVCGRCGSAFRDGAEQRAEPEPGSAVVDRSFLERRRAALDSELGAGRDASQLVAVLDEQRAQLEAALARASDQQVPLWPILDRLDRIDQLIHSLAEPPAEHVVTTAVQREGASELSGIDLQREDASQVTNWYAAFGTADEAPMAPGEGQATRTRVARALLKADGTLREPRAELGETELLVGDRVVTTKDLPELGLDAGVPGPVDRVDPAQQSVELEFATWGRLELSVKRMLEAGITYDYVSAAVTPTPSAELTHGPALDAHPLEPGPGW